MEAGSGWTVYKLCRLQMVCNLNEPVFYEHIALNSVTYIISSTHLVQSASFTIALFVATTKKALT